MDDGRPAPAQGQGPNSGLNGSDGVHSPLEGLSGYHGQDWTPQRLAFHQNLEMFAERVGLIVALQSNGKISQEAAYAEIRSIWNDLRASKSELLNHGSSAAG